MNKEEKKIYTYRFNRGTKEWEKFSMKTLCSPSDKLKKERETIIKDFISSSRKFSSCNSNCSLDS